ncbi:MAG: hypothetical protein NC111_03955 [Bacteroides sp.]|nr:hypothetical protein [Bacteroides sp.]MCM1412957.1 hypothetical protein [Bacteroides sp.]MCM1471663.1 hypothetical protein [Bacteroides sp.]
MSDYGEYNGDTVHDMWVDSTYRGNTGVVNYSYGGRGDRSGRGRVGFGFGRKKSTSELIEDCRRRISGYECRIDGIKDNIERTRRSLERRDLAPKKRLSLQRVLEQLPDRIGDYQKLIDGENAKLIPLMMRRESALNRWTVVGCIAAVVGCAAMFCLIYGL